MKLLLSCAGMHRDTAVRLLQNSINRGKGYSVRYGILNAFGDLILVDLSAPIHEARRLFAVLAHGAEVTIGPRWLNSDLQAERQP